MGIYCSLGCGLCNGLVTDVTIVHAKNSVYLNDVRACFGFPGPASRSRAMFGIRKECYLVDPASSHMLVSKIKPCMCKYELIQTVKLRMAH